jgi:Fe-S cluster biogenesis protein NfuA
VLSVTKISEPWVITIGNLQSEIAKYSEEVIMSQDAVIHVINTFRHSAQSDGGDLTLLSVHGDTVEVSYRRGDCDSGQCAMPAPLMSKLLEAAFKVQAPHITKIVIHEEGADNNH